ncbi:hypothetical protein [Mangrovicoccus sp. HB161399]|uniref:hypothetical protein n=1 Tax=Mangrovicoccus sp. HB161399 TaxID=2720392 RepID=UPI0015519C3C|nr:hypothetical protein [Mangrovicoccus sp. HB161399]
MTGNVPPPKRLAGMPDEDLLALARATGAADRMALWGRHQALARELCRRDLMDDFAPMDRRDPRTAELEDMSGPELLEEACRQIDAKGWQCMAELKAADWKLADRLQEMNLTRKLADLYGWRTRRRTGEAARQEDPRQMGSEELAAAALAMGPSGFDDLHGKDSVLYHALRSDPLAREIFRKALGLRRAPVDWKAMGDADWIALARNFGSAAEMREQYQAAWMNAAKLGKKQMITDAMLGEGAWTEGLYDQAGCSCESGAEMIVFNLMLLAGADFVRHPALPFLGDRRAARADAFLPGCNVHVEIWMCSEAGLAGRQDDVPDWFVGYVIRRREKLAAYEAAGLTVISIEAEIARLASTKAFVEHVVEVLGPVCGVQWHDPWKLRINGSCAALRWTIGDFLGYARAHGVTRLSELNAHPHTEIYNVLRSRGLNAEFKAALDREHGRQR